MRLHFRLKGTCLLPLLADPYCSTRVMYSSNSDPKSIAMFENCSGCSGCSVQARLSCICILLCCCSPTALQSEAVPRVSPLRSACCERRQLLGAAGQAQGDACSQQNRGNNFLCQQPEVEMSLFFISVSPGLYVEVSLSRAFLCVCVFSFSHTWYLCRFHHHILRSVISP